MSETDFTEERIAALERDDLLTAMERSSLYSRTRDKLIDVITAEKSRQEKFLGRLLENSPDIIITLDRDYRFVNCTDAFLRSAGIAGFGLIRNLTLFEVFRNFAPEVADGLRGALDGLGEGEDTAVLHEVMDIGNDGNPRHYEMHVTKMFERGEPDGAILLLLDITDAVQGKNKLEAVNAAMKDLLANISHDLKTPLTVMSVNLEELIFQTSEIGDRALVGKMLTVWRKNLDLQRITQNLLEVSRIEADRSIYNPDWFPLAELMMKLREKYEDFLEDQGLYLDIGYGEDALLWLDKGKIWSVFDNVVYNAARHTSSGGISIVAESGGETVTVKIHDTGSGIDAGDLPRVFERFYKGGGARGPKTGESGLGLYIVKSAMEAFGGSVAAESRPGKGTTILLTFKGQR